MNIWHDVRPDRITPEDFLTVIEISEGSKNKYELDKETGFLILDRVLYTSTRSTCLSSAARRYVRSRCAVAIPSAW